MPVRVYLKGDLPDLEGFEPDEKKPVVFGTCEGFGFRYGQGRWWHELSDCRDHIPTWLMNAASEYSIFETLPLRVSRESGIYRLGVAEAEVQSVIQGGCEVVHVCIRAKNYRDACNLLHQIKTGSVRPEPGESYEGPQCGLSRKELERKVQQLEEVREIAREERRLLVGTRGRLRRLLEELKGEYWLYWWLKSWKSFCPLLRRERVIASIASILEAAGGSLE